MKTRPFHKDSRRNLPLAKPCTFQKRLVEWSGKRDSNSRPQPWQGCALPTELFPQDATHTGIAREGAIPIQAAPDKTYPNCKRTCVWSGLSGDGLKLKGLACMTTKFVESGLSGDGLKTKRACLRYSKCRPQQQKSPEFFRTSEPVGLTARSVVGE